MKFLMITHQIVQQTFKLMPVGVVANTENTDSRRTGISSFNHGMYSFLVHENIFAHIARWKICLSK